MNPDLFQAPMSVCLKLRKEKVKQILYILDSIGILDEEYNEIAIHNEGLFRSNLVKQCIQSINGMWKSSGAKLNIRETLEQITNSFI